MPELPEVEVVRDGLERFAVGHAIKRVTVLHPRPIRRHLGGPVDFADRLAGRTIIGARRRGKYLWLPLDDGDAVLAHLGMSGQILVRDSGEEPEKHLRVLLELDAPYDVRYVDQRMFGGLSLSEDGAELPPEIAHIARDPLDQGFDDADFTARLRRRRTGIKRALLDQSQVSGIGNIYADEALWRARLHYARPTETLRRGEVASVLDGVRTVMGEALAQGGTSFDSLYVDVNGESGYFERSLNVYGRDGLPCNRCGTPIRRDAFMNRSSYTCPRCQPRPRRARW
ncbi:bifunctional DNA-formamidopyrimidine glycosylase/DNA-(apurinic or apyrimidinic site) lyase [Solicola gregarius]|uniref:Formamidopyrimidine-DNA glycosylase n=1 Tax=Solicola gregarius TaxID=2908642 RepID=A0AA46TI92_9ACTN|nr:bifunctional DNA-formamidopyrimidine glycosylase/DNA-(apurinic or apyrimidinic site) lyase [Solicola gregarius]UYM05691.1 bifunctional DNA-formamidopyrimidine glycosylase/DNA-(apurinic or apyrimidinic site) lyase [Solicola gregarius]